MIVDGEEVVRTGGGGACIRAILLQEIRHVPLHGQGDLRRRGEVPPYAEVIVHVTLGGSNAPVLCLQSLRDFSKRLLVSRHNEQVINIHKYGAHIIRCSAHERTHVIWILLKSHTFDRR